MNDSNSKKESFAERKLNFATISGLPVDRL
jgi:hypothetical protein